MYDTAAPPPTTSLAGIRAGDVVQIQQILFDNLRSHCAALGLTEGDLVRCRLDGHESLLLVTPTGRTVLLERGWARFIRVSEAPVTAPAVPSSNRLVAFDPFHPAGVTVSK